MKPHSILTMSCYRVISGSSMGHLWNSQSYAFNSISCSSAGIRKQHPCELKKMEKEKQKYNQADYKMHREEQEWEQQVSRDEVWAPEVAFSGVCGRGSPTPGWHQASQLWWTATEDLWPGGPRAPGDAVWPVPPRPGLSGYSIDAGSHFHVSNQLERLFFRWFFKKELFHLDFVSYLSSAF